MKNFIILVATIIAMCVATDVAAQSADVMPTVSVTGSAQIKVTPDEIYVSITLDESDSKGKVSVEEQRRAMFSALKKCGVNVEKQLSVQGMSSEFYRKRGSLEVTQYELKVGSAAEARKVFDSLDKAGIANVNITRVATSKLEQYRGEARQAAIRNAQMRASQLAEAVGQQIGPCVEINDYTSDVEPSTRGRLLMKNAATMDGTTAEPEVDFEQITINYNLSAKFYLRTEIKK